MDAPGSIDPLHTPRGLAPDRAQRWCVLRTVRDVRRAHERDRPISPFNARRLFQRRWHRAARHCRPRPTPTVEAMHLARGLARMQSWLDHWAPAGRGTR